MKYADDKDRIEMDHKSYIEWVRTHRVEAFMACVRAFTERDKDLDEIIHQHFMLHRTYEEIAEHMGLTVNQVRHKLRVGCYLIKKEIEREK